LVGYSQSVIGRQRSSHSPVGAAPAALQPTTSHSKTTAVIQPSRHTEINRQRANHTYIVQERTNIPHKVIISEMQTSLLLFEISGPSSDKYEDGSLLECCVISLIEIDRHLTFEISISLYQTVQCNIPEDSHLHLHSSDKIRLACGLLIIAF
jgi:hypothetical protein